MYKVNPGKIKKKKRERTNKQTLYYALKKIKKILNVRENKLNGNQFNLF